MAKLSKGCKPNNFEPHSSLKLSFTNIENLHSNFVQCKSFLEYYSPEILALCETNLCESIDSGNFSVGYYLPLIRKYYVTHMHGLKVYVEGGLPFAWKLSLENSVDSYLYMFFMLQTNLHRLLSTSLSKDWYSWCTCCNSLKTKLNCAISSSTAT